MNFDHFDPNEDRSPVNRLLRLENKIKNFIFVRISL